MKFNINSNEVVKHTARLEKLHRSALPVAIRETLNNAAFDVKKNTMPKTAKEFKKRQPNFFKANSKVEKANGFDTKSMKAVVGFFENNLVGKNYAVKDLEQQENGGTINHKSFIAQKQARKNGKMVMVNYRMNSFRGKQFIKPSSVSVNGKTKERIQIKSLKQQFIRAAIYAETKFGKDAYVLGGRNTNGNRTLSKILSIRKGRYGLEINRTPLYSVKKGRFVAVKATNFMKRASLETGLSINSFFAENARKQFIKYAK